MKKSNWWELSTLLLVMMIAGCAHQAPSQGAISSQGFTLASSGVYWMPNTPRECKHIPVRPQCYQYSLNHLYELMTLLKE